MKEKNSQPEFYIQWICIFRNKGEIKNLSDEGKNIKRKPGFLEIKKEQQRWPISGLM